MLKNPLRTFKKLFVTVFLLQVLFIVQVEAAPKKVLISTWKAFDANNTVAVDHTAWQSLLSKYVVTQAGVNLFKYSLVSSADKAALKKYIINLENTNPASLNKHEQFAYWVNLYNSKTVDLVLDEYPVSSIKRVGSILSGPWDKKYLKVNGKPLSLNNIEHGILRPIYNDERIHYVVNCASIGCPNLPKKALTGKNYKAILSQAAKEFINHTRAVEFKKDQLTLSSIFDWYGVDFGATQKQQLKSIARYASPELKAKLESYEGKIKYQYDWTLNKY